MDHSEQTLSSPHQKTGDQAAVRDSEVRFAFGKNWQRFLRYLNEQRISEATTSLEAMLEIKSLSGKSFLDVGCGSGLFSLAAMRLGAARVHSFDYDPQSVACARELKERYFRNAGNWSIEQASALDQDYLSHIGQFDVVYSWGVLHHTGNMWQAMENLVPLVVSDGKVFIALYNDQGLASRIWCSIKRFYVRVPWLRWLCIAVYGSYLIVGRFIKDVIVLRSNPLKRYRQLEGRRGMSYLTDMLDWLGGYPFEVASPESVFMFFRSRGFELLRLKTVGGRVGPNEFVFSKCLK
ncbi:MAG TPA: methyltransferase [Candidatus Angelobacter sp.]|nr:methyltransferase [Candidatus Angelobacter sp.]